MNASPLPLKNPQQGKKLRLGVVGLGRAGWDLHFQPALKHGGFEVVSVADPMEERRNEATSACACQAYESLDELLAAGGLDIVAVCTPSHQHGADVTAVLKAGIHCAAEKPVALAFEDACAMAALAEERGLRLFVNHAHLHYAEFWHLRSILDRGCLGPVFHIRACWVHFNRRWDWQTLRKFGGGALYNTGTHLLSILLPLLGSEVQDVRSSLARIQSAGDAEDHIEMHLKTVSGVTAEVLISSSMALPLPLWMICGQYGTLLFDGSQSTLKYCRPETLPALSLHEGAAPGRIYSREDIDWIEETVAIPPAPVPTFYENIHDVLRGSAEPIVSVQSVLEVARVIDRAYEASGEIISF